MLQGLLDHFHFNIPSNFIWYYLQNILSTIYCRTSIYMVSYPISYVFHVVYLFHLFFIDISHELLILLSFTNVQ